MALLYYESMFGLEMNSNKELLILKMISLIKHQDLCLLNSIVWSYKFNLVECTFLKRLIYSRHWVDTLNFKKIIIRVI